MKKKINNSKQEDQTTLRRKARPENKFTSIVKQPFYTHLKHVHTT